MGVDFFRTLEATIHVSGSASISFRPGRQERDWGVRWLLLQQKAASIGRDRAGERSARALHAAVEEYVEFFLLGYHLKDALISDGAVLRTEVEQAITSSPSLALLADLANTEKHRRLNRTSRSGNAPSIDIADRDGSAGWVPVLTIIHGDDRYDGTAFAGEVVQVWRLLLQGWKLIA